MPSLSSIARVLPGLSLVVVFLLPPQVAFAADDAGGRVVLRRLNRVEYENTIRDLLAIDVDLQDLLPPDTAASGFDNVGAALHTSSFLMERYLEAADAALGVAIANRPQPPSATKRYFFKDERHVKSTTERVFRHQDQTTVMFSSSAWQAITLSQFYPPVRGRYRFRLSASAVQSAGRPIAFRVEAGPMLMGQRNHLIDYFDAQAGAPQVFEFVDPLEARSSIRVLPYGLASAQAVHMVGADTWDGPGLAVDWVEVEGPLHDTWPPDSHRQLFGDLPLAPAPVFNQRDRVEVTSTDPAADARRILLQFAGRAFRRRVTEDDIRGCLDLVVEEQAAGQSFEQAVRVGLKAILVAPDFLFLNEPAQDATGRLDDFALASRLSYFLWSTMPDRELLELAERGVLGTAETLRQQVERMLSRPRAAALTRNFTGQWLGLRDIDFTAPDPRMYPEFDEMLKVAMVRETELFFEELLRSDASLKHLIASDFTWLNSRLAKHYGLPEVEGATFRRVTLPPGSHRGGILTMASVLKVTANGTTTSPVVRGSWILDRLLGTPPSPPPDGVPAVEPDIRGATTIREQLAKHRATENCASCHVEIDPPGFALESFDVIGGWRDHYRSIGRGDTVIVDGRRMAYHRGLPVDPSDTLPDGRKFRDIDELKQLLLADHPLVTRNLTTRLMTYATGAAPRDSDGPQIEAIAQRLTAADGGLRTLIHEVVQSDLFRHK